MPDENSYRATSRALELVSGLSERDTVLFLLSGGGSALFESPLVPAEEMADVTKQLLACGADIVEMNTLRKRLSAVKGGRFAERCLPAKVFSIVLSDILGDPLDMIASGPAYPDSSTCAQALEVVRKYGLRLSESALELLAQETPKTLTNVETHITGSVRQLCASAEQTARALGYTPVILTASLRCTARDAGSFLASIAQCHQDSKTSLAYIAGGETVVHLTGHGLGGRNQEIALSAAQEIAGLRDTAVFSFGSDGTDGPTDAAGGYCDGDTCAALAAKGISIPRRAAGQRRLPRAAGLRRSDPDRPDRHQRQRPVRPADPQIIQKPLPSGSGFSAPGAEKLPAPGFFVIPLQTVGRSGMSGSRPDRGWSAAAPAGRPAGPAPSSYTAS